VGLRQQHVTYAAEARLLHVLLAATGSRSTPATAWAASSTAGPSAGSTGAATAGSNMTNTLVSEVLL